MPRRYRMGERVAQMQITRERIVEAAIELAIEVGLSQLTMRQVGLRASVAPGTLRSHFPTRRSLEDAMVERLTTEAPLPDASIFDGASSMDERIARFLHAAGQFMSQAARLYRMWLREPMVTGPWAATGAAYGTRWSELQRQALGPLADDEDVKAVFRAVVDVPFFDALRGSTRTTDQASDLATELVVAWISSIVPSPRLDAKRRMGR